MNDPAQSDENALSIRRLILPVVGFVVFLTVFTILINTLGIERLQGFIEEAGIFAPLVYISIKALTYIVAPLTSGPIQVVAGTLFDSVWLGTLYTLIGEVLGGSISFWIARRLGRPAVVRLVGHEGMKRVDDLYENQLGGWRALAVARLVLTSIWDFLSYAAGLSNTVRFRTYLWVSIVVGSVPIFIFVWLGDSVVTDTSRLVPLYVLVTVLAAVPIIFQKPLKRLFDNFR